MLELNILNLKIVIWVKKYNQLQLFKLWANNNFITQIFTTIRENHAINNNFNLTIVEPNKLNELSCNNVSLFAENCLFLLTFQKKNPNSLYWTHSTY